MEREGGRRRRRRRRRKKRKEKNELVLDHVRLPVQFALMTEQRLPHSLSSSSLETVTMMRRKRMMMKSLMERRGVGQRVWWAAKMIFFSSLPHASKKRARSYWGCSSFPLRLALHYEQSGTCYPDCIGPADKIGRAGASAVFSCPLHPS